MNKRFAFGVVANTTLAAAVALAALGGYGSGVGVVDAVSLVVLAAVSPVVAYASRPDVQLTDLYSRM